MHTLHIEIIYTNDRQYKLKMESKGNEPPSKYNCDTKINQDIVSHEIFPFNIRF